MYTAKALALWECIRFLPPSRAGLKILGAFFPLVVLATVPDPDITKSQTHPPPRVALLGDAQSFTSIFAPQVQLGALLPSAPRALSLPEGA